MAPPALTTTPPTLRLSSISLDGSSPRCMRHLQALECPSKRRRTTEERICDEMTATEKDYVTDLTALIERFLDPLAAFADQYCNTNADLPAFTALRTSAHFILGVHQELLKLLEPPPQPSSFFNLGRILSSAASTPGPLEAVTRVTKAFASMIEYMKVYALYCANYLRATEELKAHAKLLDAFTLAQACNDNHVPYDAASDLIKPVQRICRYSLLFRALVQNATSPNEVALAQQALASVQRVSDLVNARVRDAENNARLVSLHDSIGDSKRAAKLQLLRPGRTLLCEMTAAVQVIDRFARVARVLHLPEKFYHPQPQTIPSQSVCDNASVNSEMELLDASGCPNDETERRASVLRETLVLNSQYAKDRQRLILLSDELLIAKKGKFHLRVRRHICLSCAKVIEATDADDNNNSATSSRSFGLLASKTGRCNCHNLSPNTLKRPLRKRRVRTTNTARAPVDELETDMVDVTISSPASSRRRTRWITRQYIIHCESETKKNEFVALLRHAIAHCARSPAPRRTVTCTTTKLPSKLWQSINFSQMGYSSLRRHRTDTLSASGQTDFNGEHNSDEFPPHQTDRLLRSRSATSGAA